MARPLILAFLISTFSQFSQGAIRYIYDKPESAASACQAHEFNSAGGACDSPYPSTGFSSVFTTLLILTGVTITLERWTAHPGQPLLVQKDSGGTITVDHFHSHQRPLVQQTLQTSLWISLWIPL